MGGSLVGPGVVLPPADDIDKLPMVLNALLAPGGHPQPERTAAPCAELEDLLKWNADGLAELATFHRDVQEHRRQINGKLSIAVDRSGRHPYGVVALIAFLHGACDSVWEVSYHYEPMWYALRRLRSLWQEHQPWHDDRERRIGEALLDLVDNLYCEIHAENAMTCGFVDRAAEYYAQAHDHAIRAHRGAREVLDEITLAADPTPADRAARCYGAYVVDWTESSRHYDSGAANAARGIARFLSGRGGLDETRRAVLEAEQALLRSYDPDTPYPTDIGTGQDWSEIRAYRHDIDALIEASHQPWLCIDDGTITYIYPFALRLPDSTPAAPASLMAAYQAFVDRLPDLTSPDEATREVEVARQDRVLDELSRLRVGGVPVTRVRRRFVLDDVWHGTDVSGRRFDGFVLDLPTVTLHVPTGNPDDPDVAAGEVVTQLAAEVRLSHLGNHYVKFTGRLRNVGPHDLHSALLRAAPEHGAMVVTFDATDDGPVATGGQPVPLWPRLSALAMTVIDDLCRGMGAEKTASEGSFQVLLTITAASTTPAPGTPALGTPAPGTPAPGTAAPGAPALGTAALDVPGIEAPRLALTDLDALRAAYGAAVLFNPVPHMVTSFVEWSHYAIPDGAEVGTPWGRRGRTTIRTANTTVHVALGAPHWELATTCTISEFVASLAGLFGRWMEQLNEHAEEVNRHRDALETVMESDDPEALERLRRAADLLRTKRLDLQTFITQCRSMIALIKSPALVRSPAVAAQMARMLEAGGFHLLEQGFNRRAEQVLSNDLQAVIDKAATDMEERTERRHRRHLDTLLAVIAAIGVSGLAQLIQAGYGFGGEVSLAFAVAICLLAAIVGTAVASRYRVTRPRPVDRVARHGKRRVGRQADPARATVGGMGVGPRRATPVVDPEVLAPAQSAPPRDS
jgi:hypothetical protein